MELTDEQIKHDHYNCVCAYVRKIKVDEGAPSMKTKIELRDSMDGRGSVITTWAYNDIKQPDLDDIKAAITANDIEEERKLQIVEKGYLNTCRLVEDIFNEIKKTDPLAFSGKSFTAWAYDVSVGAAKR